MKSKIRYVKCSQPMWLAQAQNVYCQRCKEIEGPCDNKCPQHPKLTPVQIEERWQTYTSLLERIKAKVMSIQEVSDLWEKKYGIW